MVCGRSKLTKSDLRQRPGVLLFGISLIADFGSCEVAKDYERWNRTANDVLGWFD